MQKKSKLYVLIALGIIISGYLILVRFDNSVLACPNTGFINCESVTTSQYSQIFGIPLAILGLVLFILAIFMLTKEHDTFIFLWSIAGAGAVIYSVISQVLLGEICIYCLALDAVILLCIYVANAKQKLTQQTPPAVQPA